MAISKTMKKRWLRALRSGKYRATTQSLWNSAGERCALGVLAAEYGKPIDVQADRFDTYGWLAGQLGDRAMRRVWRVNDRRPGRTDFEDVAQWIEENL